MDILFCLDIESLNAFPYGAYRACLEIAKGLMNAGCRVRLAGVADQPSGLVEGVPFIGDRNREELATILRHQSPVDVAVGVSGLTLARFARARSIMIYNHNPCTLGVSSKLINISHIPLVCVSDFSKNQQVEFGINPNLIHIVPNGYDQQIFTLNNSACREKHRLVFAGNGVYYKGLDILLQAFQKIQTVFPDAVLSIYGNTPPWNASGVDELEPGWLKNGILNWEIIQQNIQGVEYHGEASPTALANAFRGASLLLMPSRIGETFGLVSVEAQACGCIPVLPHQGGFPETMQAGQTGYLYTENNSEALTRMVCSLWSQGMPEEGQRYLAANWVKQQFSWSVASKIFLEMIETHKSIPARWVKALLFLYNLYAWLWNKLK